MFVDVKTHYDMLIDEDNDPVYDPQPLKKYMDKWDGDKFIHNMELTKNKTVLEIGIGTGRLALRVAPMCKTLYGIDISSKSIERANSNLSDYKNVRLVCDDFMTTKIDLKFDVIYSSLTFMHIEDKPKAVSKIASMLALGGLFVLSIDKNQNEYIDMKTRKIKIYPDNSDEMLNCILNSGLDITSKYETEMAYIFVAKKN